MKKASITKKLVNEDGLSVRRSASFSGNGKDRPATESAKPILSAVTREMDKPRVARSARRPMQTG